MGVAGKYGEVVVETAKWLTYKPTVAVVRATKAVAESTAGKFVAGGLGTVAAGLGIKSWHDKRNERYASQQADKAYNISQQIVDKQDKIMATQASIGNPDARTDNLAKVEAAKQQQTQPELSLS